MIGRQVARCLADGITFADLSPSDWAAVHPVFAVERPPLTADESVAARDVEGGTAPNRVRAAHAGATAALAATRAWLAEREASLAAVMARERPIAPG
jgi:argininosuccinate lyase